MLPKFRIEISCALPFGSRFKPSFSLCYAPMFHIKHLRPLDIILILCIMYEA